MKRTTIVAAIIAGAVQFNACFTHAVLSADEPDPARQMLEDFYHQHPPRPAEAILQQQVKSVHQWAQNESLKLVPQVSQSIKDVLQAGTPPAKAQDPTTTPRAANLTPTQVESLSKSIADSTRKLWDYTAPSQSSPSQDQGDAKPSDNAKPADAPDKTPEPIHGTPDATGPIKFVMPNGWRVDLRDAKGVRMKRKEEGGNSKTFIMIYRHPGFGAMGYPYTPEGIARGMTNVGGFTKFPHGSQVVNIGKERRPGMWVWSSRSDVGVKMEHTFVAADGGVYMIHTGYAPDDADTKKDYDAVLQSIEFTDAAAKQPETTPQQPSTPADRASDEQKASPTSSVTARQPTKEELEKVAQTVNEQFVQFFGTNQRALSAIEQARKWIGSEKLGNDYTNNCLMFVKDAYGFPAIGIPNAEAARTYFGARGVLHSSSWTEAPTGSWLFFDYRKGSSNWGHVAIVTGPGKLIDAFAGTGFKPSQIIQERTMGGETWYAKHYQGWVNPQDVIRLYTKQEYNASKQ